jgi:chorismate mutase
MLAVRGAVQVERDTPDAMAAAVRELCTALSQANRLTGDRIISAIFTLTPDLSSAFPARAAREQGWGDVPMLCAQEVAVPGSMPRVCRVLLHVRAGARVRPRHVYLGEAKRLRPDLS